MSRRRRHVVEEEEDDIDETDEPFDPYDDDEGLFVENLLNQNYVIRKNIFVKFKPVPIKKNDFTVSTTLIYLGRQDLATLITFFEPTYDMFDLCIKYLFKSPYRQEFIENFVVSWYTQGEFNSSETIRSFSQEFYIPEKSNNWFFRIVNELHPLQRNYILEKYVNNTIDETVSFDLSTPITYYTISKERDYRRRKGIGVRVGDFMTDLKQVAIYVENVELFILKKKSPLLRKAELRFLAPSQFKNKLSQLKLGVYGNAPKVQEITAWKILSYGSNMNFITVQDMCFYSDNANIFSIFQGYEYDVIEGEVNLQIIEPVINHIYNVICNRNPEAYRYLIFWLAYLFKNPSGKTETAIVLTGMQGCGKNTFTNIICRLLGTYANDNATINDITGKFNNAILYKKLIICNEVKSYIANKVYDGDRMKTLITENTIDINLKFHDSLHQENIANFILISNNFAPIKIEEGDRRYFVLEVSSEHLNDREYFNNIINSLTDEFYSNFLTFLMRIDTTNWDKFNIPLTPAKKAIMEFSKSPYSTFIQSTIHSFLRGFAKDNAFKTYKEWCNENGYIVGNLQNFRVGVLKFCEEKTITVQNKRMNVYLLRDECKIHFTIPNQNNDNEDYDSDSSNEFID